MDVPLQAPRYCIEPTADGLRVLIPAPRQWLIIIFLSLWMVGWFFGESSALAQLFGFAWPVGTRKQVEPAFLSLWLAAWTAGGVLVTVTILWQLAGREVLTADSLALTQRIEAFGLGITRSYALREIRDLRPVPNFNSLFARQRSIFSLVSGNRFGSIAFDYGARTIHLAPGLEEAEAKMLVADLSRRLKVQPASASML